MDERSSGSLFGTVGSVRVLKFGLFWLVGWLGGQIKLSSMLTWEWMAQARLGSSMADIPVLLATTSNAEDPLGLTVENTYSILVLWGLGREDDLLQSRSAQRIETLSQRSGSANNTKVKKHNSGVLASSLASPSCSPLTCSISPTMIIFVRVLSLLRGWD